MAYQKDKFIEVNTLEPWNYHEDEHTMYVNTSSISTVKWEMLTRSQAEIEEGIANFRITIKMKNGEEINTYQCGNIDEHPDCGEFFLHSIMSEIK